MSHSLHAFAFQAIEKTGLVDKSVFLKPQTCQAEALERVHSKSYLSQAEKDIKQGASQLSTGDTSISKDSWEVAQQATGGIVGALDQIMSGSIDRAFA